jgi:hypothetical protein
MKTVQFSDRSRMRLLSQPFPPVQGPCGPLRGQTTVARVNMQVGFALYGVPFGGPWF